jgi:hypothetical protein
MAWVARGPVVGQSYQAVLKAVMTMLHQAGLWLPPGEFEP